MLITGSTAAYYHGLVESYPKDLDTFYYEGYKVKGEDSHTLPRVLYEKLSEGSSEGFISKDNLYTLKCSHLQWDIKWEKTKRDILLYKFKGCSFNETLYNDLVEYWKVIHGDKSFLNLAKSKEEFFTDSVNYKFDHDYLHEVVAEGLGLKEPTYKKCLKNDEEVLIDKMEFDNRVLEDQVSMFRQEIAVIAFERWVIYGKISWVKAHGLSLKKTITNLTKGESSKFLIKNLELFVKPDYNYYSNLIKLLEE